MTFKLEKTKQVKFDCIDGMMTYLEMEKKNTKRINIGDLLGQAACFSNDGSFGKSEYAFKFNAPAMYDLCRILNLYPPMLEQLEKPGLASDILNDRINSEGLKDKLNKTQFVFDEPSKTVLGLVGVSYIGYSNQDFLDDVCFSLSGEKQKSWIPNFGEFDFSTSYSINTHLSLRLKNESKKGVVKGKGGEGDDESILGLQISNSMAGGKALQMAYFVERMLCANGLILPVGGTKARLIHAGQRENFNKRLTEKMADVVGSLGTVKKTIELLGDIEFCPEKLAKQFDLKKLYSTIPGKDLEQLGSNKLKNLNEDLKQFDKGEREHQRNIMLIAEIPYLIGGEHSDKVFKSQYRDNATMFDFINVFTEEAKKCVEPSQRIQIEKSTGEFADFIAKNKQSFV